MWTISGVSLAGGLFHPTLKLPAPFGHYDRPTTASRLSVPD
jgi:hypothetical protein